MEITINGAKVFFDTLVDIIVKIAYNVSVKVNNQRKCGRNPVSIRLGKSHELKVVRQRQTNILVCRYFFTSPV